ncbi:MAG TPA: hypothetical protein VJO15_05265 [Dehalococcoidia bacterium]|nr:hypothetical protein [Dehalococcoidia bacterium]
MRESFLRKLVATVKCNSCGQRYDKAHIHVLAHQDGLWFLQVSCSSCNNSGLVAAVFSEERASSVVTDLTPAEFSRFQHTDAVTADDVLRMHVSLKDFGGDFKAIFGG